MNPIYILRYIKGYVTFTAKGGFTERFINLCSINGILLWDTSYSDNILRSKCQIKSISKLRKAAKNSGVILRFTDSYGLYNDLKKQKDRLGLLIGAVFFVVFYTLMSCFVWTIDVSGNNTIPYDEIIEKADLCGLHIGTFKPLFDETAAANLLSSDSNGEISWCAFNIKGSRALIEIREQKASLKDDNIIEPCNIISDSDGIILSIEVYEGVGEVNEGDAVNEGDLLINGVNDNEDYSILFVEADGKITAETDKSFGLRFNKSALCRKITSSDDRLIFNVFSISLPTEAIHRNNFSSFSHCVNLDFNDVVLPVSVTVETAFETEETKRSETELTLSSVEKYSYEARKFNSNSILLTENPTIYISDSEIIIENQWKTISFIGEKQKISIEN